MSWQTQVDRDGLQGMRTTRIQEYRGGGRRPKDTMCVGQALALKAPDLSLRGPELEEAELQTYRAIRAAPPAAAEPCPALRR